MAEFGERLRTLRISSGLTVSETARQAGISRAYYQRLERADRDAPISASLLIALAKVLRCGPEQILPEMLGEGSRAERPSALVTFLLRYLDGTDPDPSLVSGLFRLLGTPLTPDEWRVAHKARFVLYQPSSPAMWSELRALMAESGIDLNDVLRARLEEIGFPRGVDADAEVRASLDRIGLRAELGADEKTVGDEPTRPARTNARRSSRSRSSKA